MGGNEPASTAAYGSSNGGAGGDVVAKAAVNGNGVHHHQHVNGNGKSAMKAALEELKEDAAGEKSGRDRSHSETPSVEDYDEISRPQQQRVSSPLSGEFSTKPSGKPSKGSVVIPGDDAAALSASLKEQLLAENDAAIQEILRRGSQRAKEDDPSGKKPRRPGRFSKDTMFSRKFSAFDRQNEMVTNSPFHGFFTLFWMTVFLYMVKIGSENVVMYGNPFGKAEVMGSMFLPDLAALFIFDGIMCGLSGVSWVLQWLVYAGYIHWDGAGWVLQNLWQTAFIGGVVGLTLVRDWPWTHTVFFVLHGLVMLMKQHSYAFYNGYLSTQHKTRADLVSKLARLEETAPVQSPSKTEPPASAVSTSHLAHPPSAHEMKERRASLPHHGGGGGEAAVQAKQALQEVSDIDKIAEAIRLGEPLDADQIHVFKRVLRWEADALTDELKGKSTAAESAYPNNLTLWNQYRYNLLPTLVYELEYPRSDAIRWGYVAEKAAAMVGIIFIMIMVSQRFIYPVVMKTVEMKEMGLSLADQFQSFPWMLGELILPFMLEYLMTWYLIWETILNLLAELTYFADRDFYGPWWNSVSWDQFARDWNRPVHMFLLRHVYHSSISAMKVNKHTATLITFFLSACVHELVMWCIFKKLRGFLLMLQMGQLPLVRLSRTRWLRGKESLGNIIFWMGLSFGPSILCSLYLLL